MKKIGLCRLSDPVSLSEIQALVSLLERHHRVLVSPYLFEDVDGFTRAKHLNRWFQEDFDVIFDVSGGNLSLEALPYLDRTAYEKSPAWFAGYSDLTPVLNVLSFHKPTVLLQIKGHEKMEEILSWIEKEDSEIFYSKRHYIGGNIRCFLKLAGTSYFPEWKGKDLFLESRSGNLFLIRSYLKQLELMHVFEEIRSLSLGQFSQLDSEGNRNWLVQWSQNMKIPVEHTLEVGHSKDSKALWICQDSDKL